MSHLPTRLTALGLSLICSSSAVSLAGPLTVLQKIALAFSTLSGCLLFYWGRTISGSLVE